MTPRERKDMPWLVALSAGILLIILFGLFWA